MFPARPNHQTAWIERDDVRVIHHNWHAEVDTTANRLRVWEGDELRVDTLVVAGTPSTPTPLGRYYVNEKQEQATPYTAYGSWILSTNGFSEAHERFSGEVPIFGLHGTPYPDTIGQDLSNGCIRMPNDIVEYLAAHMPVGTPVDVFT
jgi:lipoprotein-anchoring transpeptidase ErfK/SrfK